MEKKSGLENSVTVYGKELTKKRNVVESNRVIEGCSNLTPEAQKILYTTIAMIEKDDTDFCGYVFRVVELKNLFNSSSRRFYERVEQACDTLMKAFVTIRDLDKPKNFLKLHLVKSCKYADGELQIKMDDEVASLFLQLKNNFTKVPLAHFLELRSTYSMRMLSLIISRWNIAIQSVPEEQRINFKCSFVMTLEQLHNMFLYNEVNSYSTFGNLNLRIIKPAVKELNEKSIFHIEPELIKEKRSVCAIRLRVKYSEKGRESIKQKAVESIEIPWEAEDSICRYFEEMFKIQRKDIIKLHKSYDDYALKASALSMQKYQDDFCNGEPWRELTEDDLVGIRIPIAFLRKCLKEEKYLDMLQYESLEDKKVRKEIDALFNML
jgi:plasmid replication initiation protein